MTCKPTTLATLYAGTYLNRNDFTGLNFVELISRESNPINRFDRNTLVAASQSLNRTIRLVNLGNYPFLSSRVFQSNILYPEVADFLIQSNFDLDDFQSIVNNFESYVSASNLTPPLNINRNPVNPLISQPNNYTGPGEVPVDYIGVLNELENYYAENIANTVAGGFCGAFANPFNQILQAVATIQLGTDLLSKLLNFSLDDLFNKLDTLKEKLLTIVDQLKNSLINQVQSIVSNIATQVESFGRGANRAFNVIWRRLQNVQSFLENFSIDNIKSQIEEFINQSVAQFEELTPEAIALLMFRFCQFSELIQSFMKSPVDALSGYVNSLFGQQQILSQFSREETGRAVRAGAVRLSEAGILDAQSRMSNATSEGRYGDQSGPSDYPAPALYVRDPNLTAQDRAALARISEEGIPGRLVFTPSVQNMGASSSVTDAVRGDGWRRVEPYIWARAVIAAREFGRELTVLSAYRSRQYNQALRDRGIRAALNSAHTTGQALDISTAGFSDSSIRNLIRIYSQVGFEGMAYYPGDNFIHVDYGSHGRRIWNTGHRFTRELEIHRADGFRRGNMLYDTTLQEDRALPEASTSGPF